MTSAYMPLSVQTLGEGREYSVRDSKEILQTPCGVCLAEKLTILEATGFLCLRKNFQNTW